MRTVNRRPRRDEQGAYAVMFALLSLVLLSFAAIAVDLGQAMSRRSDVQGQADFGALAGGAKLTSSALTSIPPDVATAVAESMNRNLPRNGDCTGCITAAQLTNTNLADGEIRITAAGMEVLAPQDQVDYGFARVMGFNNIQVQAAATVQISTPGTGAMPMYAAAGCDYGTQTLTDPASGHVVSTHDNLAFGADDASAEISSITAPSPAQVALTAPAAPGPPLTVAGTNFIDVTPSPTQPDHTVTHIGFFLNDGSTMHSVPLDPARLNDATTASIAAIPAAVTSVEDVWWVRVFHHEDGAGPAVGVWSSESDARPLRVGGAQLECDAGSNDGNFGTLRLPRTDVAPAGNLPMNIAKSFQEPLSLVVHAGAVASGLCTPGSVGVVASSEHDDLRRGTNCVQTDPGLAANDTAAGLVEGYGSSPGRLDVATVCGSNITINLHGSHTINGDTLECFLGGRSTVAAITNPAYNGDAVLSKTIYDSPRFVWVPVLAVDANRGSKYFSIIDFRPAFISELHVQGNDIDQVKVIFFNKKALPSRADGQVIDYIGVGPKILRLVN